MDDNYYYNYNMKQQKKKKEEKKEDKKTKKEQPDKIRIMCLYVFKCCVYIKEIYFITFLILFSYN